MPQELRVVHCFQCLKYQVDIVKKANKWVCKLCGVKQSLAREFFRGSGKDCRSMVQQLSIRNLEMDQQEAEVTKLVLQNKILLPKPPPESAPTSTITETNVASQRPSKWETFLTKETNDDLSDAICSSESLESVSSTTFDRERINNRANNFVAKGTRNWNYRPMNRENVSDDEEKRCSNIGKDSPSQSKAVIAQKNPVFNPISSTSNAKVNTYFKNADADRRCSYSAGNDSSALPSFNRRENINRRTFPNPSKKIEKEKSQASVSEIPTTSKALSSSVSYKPPEMRCKRKFADVFATPPMNFGKRTVNTSKLAPVASAESLSNVNDSKPQTECDSVSSKWAKYLPEDDVTNENTDNNFIIF